MSGFEKSTHITLLQYSNLTFDLISRLVFGESVNAQTTEEGQKYLEAWDGVLGLANILALLQSLADKWIWRFFPSIKSKHQKDVDMIYSLVDRNLARRKRGEDLDRVSILDDLFRNGKVPGWLKEDAALKAQLTTLLFAGHDVGTYRPTSSLKTNDLLAARCSLRSLRRRLRFFPF